MVLRSLTRYRETGLLFLRLGLGSAFIAHGMMKLIGGPNLWQAMAIATGVRRFPVVFGFTTAAAEALAGGMILLGWFFRPACILLVITMAIKVNYHFGRGHPFSEYSYAVQAVSIFFSLIFIGPGRYSMDRR